MPITISNVIPSTAEENEQTRIEIQGTDVSQVASIVFTDIARNTFNGTAIQIINDARLSVLAPGLDSGVYTITVSNTDGTETYTEQSGLIVIESIPDFPFETEDFNRIQRRMLARLPADSDTRQGSTYWDIFAPVAVELEQYYLALREGIELGFLTTTTGDFLSLKAVEYGLVRRTAASSEVILRFTADREVTVPRGTIVRNNTTIDSVVLEFATNEDLVFNVADTDSVLATAVNTGARYNLSENTLVELPNSITGITAVTNPEPSYGGTDDENEEDFRSRITTRARTPSRGGNIGDYIYWAQQAHRAVQKVGVFPLKRGNGTVDVAILGASDVDLPTSVVKDVQDYIAPTAQASGARLAPIGASVLVKNATKINVLCDVKINLAFGILITDIQSRIQTEVGRYFNNLEIGESVRLFELSQVIERVSGVDGINSISLHRSDGMITYNHDLADNINLVADNNNPVGLGSDGTHLFSIQDRNRQVYVNSITTGLRDTTMEFTLDSGNTGPRGMHVTPNRIFVGDRFQKRIYAYDHEGDTVAGGLPAVSAIRAFRDFTLHGNIWYILDAHSSGDRIVATHTGSQIGSESFNIPSNIDNPTAIFSNDDYIWIISSATRIAYRFEWDGTRSSAGDITLHETNDDIRGAYLDEDNGALYVQNNGPDEIFIYVPDQNVSVARDEKLVIRTLALNENNFTYSV